jgi:hypothetical protein
MDNKFEVAAKEIKKVMDNVHHVDYDEHYPISAKDAKRQVSEIFKSIGIDPTEQNLMKLEKSFITVHPFWIHQLINNHIKDKYVFDCGSMYYSASDVEYPGDYQLSKFLENFDNEEPLTIEYITEYILNNFEFNNSNRLKTKEVYNAICESIKSFGLRPSRLKIKRTFHRNGYIFYN